MADDKKMNAGLKAAMGKVSMSDKPAKTKEQKEAELAGYVNGLFQREMTRQRREHPIWYMALSFLSGKQWVFYNERANIVDVVPRRSATDRMLTLNRIRPIMETILSQITSSNPKWQVAPNYTNEGGMLASRGWQQWYDWVWRTKNLERTIRDQVLVWSALTGRGWLRVTWDGGGGKKRIVRIPVEPEMAEPSDIRDEIMELLAGDGDVFNDEGQFEEREVPEGDFAFKAVSPFNIFIDPSAESVENIRWLLESSYVSRQEVEELYGVEVHPDIQPSPNSVNYTKRVREGVRMYSDQISTTNIVGITGGDKYVAGTGLYGEDDFRSMVLLKELWVAPNKEYPEGRYVVVANNKVLSEETNPYGRIPYVPFTWMPRQGSTYADGLVPALIDLQKELNRSFSRLSTNMLVHASPPWLIDARSQIDPSAFSDRENSLIIHNTPLGGAPPRRVQPPNLTGNAMAYLSMINQQMEEVAGLHAADKGINPSGGRSASMLVALRNASMQSRRPTISRYKESLQDVGQLILEITRRYVREPRLVPAIGRDGTVVVTEFTRQDIENGYDVRVIVGEGLPDDPMIRSEYLLGMVRAGVYKMEDDEDRRIIQRQLEFGDVRSFYDDDSTTERLRIHQENLDMLKRQLVEVKEYDLHQLHAEGHTKFMRSKEAQDAFKKNPELEQILRQHKDTHLDWLSAEGAQVPFVPGQSVPGQPPLPAGLGGGLANSTGVDLAGLLGPSAAPQ